MSNIENINFFGKKVLIRVDFNVPFSDDFKIEDATRIKAVKKTIDKVLKDNGSVILMAHLGRPKGKFNEKLSFKNLLKEIEKELGLNIHFSSKTIGEEAKYKADNLKNGEVLLLENLRFYKEETEGDVEFAKKLAELADVYINDAFGAAHRKHASTAVVAEFFKEKCFGYLMNDELKAIDKIFKEGEKPVTAIIGGAKVSSKIGIIENLFPVVDNILIGGGMTYTFVKAMGGNVGNSLVEDEYLENALKIIENAKKNNVKLYFPEDSIIADKFDKDANTKTALSKNIDEGWMGLDIGVKAIDTYKNVIKNSKTILWNGPMGVFEFDLFENGTKEIGFAAAEATKKGAFSLIGGGDSVAAANKYELNKKLSYISTGGGAMLESLEGKTLPGVAGIVG